MTDTRLLSTWTRPSQRPSARLRTLPCPRRAIALPSHVRRVGIRLRHPPPDPSREILALVLLLFPRLADVLKHPALRAARPPLADGLVRECARQRQLAGLRARDAQHGRHLPQAQEPVLRGPVVDGRRGGPLVLLHALGQGREVFPQALAQAA